MAWIEVHQGLREHRKTYACAEMLKINCVVMVGTLVSLWLWALDNAQDGSLDGISNRTIARVCDWPEKKASDLISALVECGWLDKDGEILRIHDWTDYAGRLMERREKDKVRKKKTREKQWKSVGSPQEVHGKSSATVPIPYPTVPNPIINGSNTGDICDPAAGQAPAIKDGRSFTLFWDDYPNKADREDAWEAWKTLNPDSETVWQIKACWAAWKLSGQWLDDGGRYIPSAAKWLSKRRWECLPPPSKKDSAIWGACELGQAELEAIQRMLKEDGNT